MSTPRSLPWRRPIRLRGYDYSLPGDYFVTICVRGRRCVLGRCRQGMARLNEIGEMVYAAWMDLPARYPGVALDRFIIMPNHVHGILILTGEAGNENGPRDSEGRQVSSVGAGRRARPLRSLPDVVQRFKSWTTALYRVGVQRRGWPDVSGGLWQRGYFDRVIRDLPELQDVRAYIDENPLRWGMGA